MNYQPPPPSNFYWSSPYIFNSSRASREHPNWVWWGKRWRLIKKIERIISPREGVEYDRDVKFAILLEGQKRPRIIQCGTVIAITDRKPDHTTSPPIVLERSYEAYRAMKNAKLRANRRPKSERNQELARRYKANKKFQKECEE